MNEQTVNFLQSHMTTLCTSVLMGSTDGTRAFIQWLPQAIARNPRIRIFLLQNVVDELQAIANDASRTADIRQHAAEGMQAVSALYSTGRVQIFSVPQSTFTKGRLFAEAVLHVARGYNECHLAVLTQSGELAAQLVDLNAQLPSANVVKVRRISGRDGGLCCFNLMTRQPSHPAAFQAAPAATAKPVLTRLSKEPLPIPTVEEDSVVEGNGALYTLDELLDAGAESMVYTVKGHPELLCKVLTAPTQRKLAKLEYLCSLPRIPGAVLPECIVKVSGQTVGYLMPRLDNAIPLVVLGTDSGLKREARHFTRQDFITIAIRMVSICQALLQHGVMLSDFSLTNIMVGKDEHGLLNASRVALIDVDSAQITRSGEVIPGDGGTPDFLSPRLCLGFNEDTIRHMSDYEYMVTLMAITIVLGVQHPFLAVSDGEGINLQEAIYHGRFPMDRFNQLRSPLAYIFSYMTPGIKAVANECFTASAAVNGMAASAEADPYEGKFPGIARLVQQLRHYHEWVADPATLARFPQAQSLNPTERKPYLKPGQQRPAPVCQPELRPAPVHQPATPVPACPPPVLHQARQTLWTRMGNGIRDFFS